MIGRAAKKGSGKKKASRGKGLRKCDTCSLRRKLMLSPFLDADAANFTRFSFNIVLLLVGLGNLTVTIFKSIETKIETVLFIFQSHLC